MARPTGRPLDSRYDRHSCPLMVMDSRTLQFHSLVHLGQVFLSVVRKGLWYVSINKKKLHFRNSHTHLAKMLVLLFLEGTLCVLITDLLFFYCKYIYVYNLQSKIKG